MKKIFSKVALSLLGIGSLCSVVGCGQNAAPAPEEDDPNHGGEVIVVDDQYLIKNGESSYQVVVPENLTTNLKNARDELVRFVEEATGVKLNVITDSGRVHDANSTYISLGNTSLFQSLLLPPTTLELGRDGTKIVTIDKTIYIIGGGDYGVLYGVYDFLNINFNFESYAPHCYTLDTGVKEVKFKEYNIVDIPDIPYRVKRSIQFATTADQDDVMFCYRQRYTDSYGNMLFPIHKGDSRSSASDVFHNSLFYIPVEQYGQNHPEYFSSDKLQLCYTGRGNSQTVEEMTDICAQKIINSLMWYTPEEFPNYSTVQMGVMDTDSFCNCSTCRHCRDTHNGSNSAAVIMFLNKVGVKVNAWMARPENEQFKRDLTYMFLAYQKTLTPPYTDPNNIPQDIIPSEGVKIMPFCAFSGFNYGVSFYDASNNENRKNIELWGNAFPGGWAWSYGGFFHDYFAFYDLYGFYDDYHAFLKKNNFAFTFEQIHDDQRGAETGFFTMAQYVVSKKAWNTNLCVTDLMDNYMHAMYGEAYPQMNEVLTHFKLQFAKMYKDKNWASSSIQQEPTANSTCYSFGFVNQALKLFNNAYEAIEVYKDDPILYQKYLDRIDQEWLFIGLIILRLYQNNFTYEQLYDIKVKFRDVCNKLGILELREFERTQLADFISGLFA